MRLAGIICLVLALVGCGDRAAPQWVSLDGFERDPMWAHDSADDHAELTCQTNEAVEGVTALVVRAHAGSRGKVLLRKEIELDASGLDGLRMSARLVDGPGATLAVAMRGADGTWLESPPFTLSKSWQHELTWDPRTLPAWAKSAPHIDRLLLLVRPQGGDVTVALDDLRALGAWRWRSDPATLQAVQMPPAQAARNQPVALTYDVVWPVEAHAAELSKPVGAQRLMRRMVAGGAWITAPDGERWFQNGVCISIGAEAGLPRYRYAVRFTPNLTGVWIIEPGLATGAGAWQWGARGTVTVSADAAHPGAARLDASGRWFERGDGSFLWPLGMNVAWAGDYTPWLDRLQRDGCTVVRVWLCPWSNPLDVAGDLQTVNQASAASIDGLLDAAAARGLSVQLCLTYHGWFGGDWSRNPFNAAHGGPITDARDFWTDGQAREGFRKVLDYVSARWGHHPGLLAWELVNEADLAPRHADEDVVAWHAEMSAHLARIDRHRHPITTSVAEPGHLRALWRLPYLDLVNIHRYDADPRRAIAAVARDIQIAGKPGWTAEAGRDWRPAQALAERDGVYLRQALWWSWVNGLAASSWAWWWDVQVQNQDLTRHHAALSRFLAGEDPRGLELHPVSSSADGLAVGALVGSDRAWVYTADPQAAQPAVGTPSPPARQFVILGLAPGTWTVERWDPLSGSRADTQDVIIPETGLLSLSTQAGSGESAWKLRRRLPLVPGVQLPPESGR